MRWEYTMLDSVGANARPRTPLLLACLALAVLLGACAPSGGAETAGPPSADIAGAWAGTLHVVRSDESRAPLPVTYTIGELVDGGFGYEHSITLPSGEVLERSGQGTLGGDGRLLLNQDGQNIVTQGRVIDADTIEIQSVELIEAGSGAVAGEVTFAGIATLARETATP